MLIEGLVFAFVRLGVSLTVTVAESYRFMGNADRGITAGELLRSFLEIAVS